MPDPERDIGSIADVPYLEADRREIAGVKSQGESGEEDIDLARSKTPSGTAVVISISVAQGRGLARRRRRADRRIRRRRPTGTS